MTDNWLQCTEPFPGDEQMVAEFRRLFTDDGGPKGCALLNRVTERPSDKTPELVIYVLTPPAAKYAEKLRGRRWIESLNPQAHDWMLVAGDTEAYDQFSLPR